MSGIFDQIINYSPPLIVSGTVNYKGTWNASTNTPTLVDPPVASTKGNYYVVSTAGTQFSITFGVGDWIISNGTAWEKVDLTDAVSSVFGRTGSVVGVSTDYSAVGITNTAIGASSPSTGAFTTVNATTLTVSGLVSVGAEVALRFSPAPTYNYFFGPSGNGTMTGKFNTALGFNSLFSNTTGEDNTAIGLSALRSNTTGTYNVGMGSDAAYDTTTGSNNVFLGVNTIRYNVTGGQNVAIGTLALQGVTGNSFSYNVAVGSNAGRAMTTGSYNATVGDDSQYAITSGVGNASVGADSLRFVTTGSGNGAFGRQALYDVTTGGNNVGLGYQSGKGITTGSGNTVLGANVTGLSATLANNIILANGTGAIKAQHDGTNWALTGNVTASNLSGTNTGDQTITLTGGVTGSGTGSFAATVVTNANLTGAITSVGNATSLGSFTSANLASAVTDETGSGALVFSTSPTIATPVIAQINDANGNSTLRLTGITSATDYLEIKNGIGVGSPLHVLAEGASANIGVHLQPKGSGLFTISDGTDFNKGIRFRSSSSAASAVTLIDAVSTAGRVVTLPDATGTLLYGGGPLGTPSSGTVTNLTGTASININGTVGATTPSTGAFTTLSASGTATSNQIILSGTTASFPTGSLAVGAVNGVTLIGKAGSSFDFAITNSSGLNVLTNPTGTQNAQVAGTLTIGGASPPTVGVLNSVGTLGFASSDNTNSSIYIRHGSGGSIIGTDTGGNLRIAAGGNTASQVIGDFTSTGLAVTGALSSTGALAIGNTVATAVAVASTHKVTIVIGGVTYYLLATNV